MLSFVSYPLLRVDKQQHSEVPKLACTRRRMSVTKKVSSSEYYGEYHGHRVEHLAAVHEGLGKRGRIWLAGDSSLDSKYYQAQGIVDAVNGYEGVLDEAKSRQDVCYWMNRYLGGEYATINCAIEESTLAMRGGGARLPVQDEFLRDHINVNDVLVVSVGGNDVALRPTIGTAFAALRAVLLNGDGVVKECGWGVAHFTRMFRDDTQMYVQRLTSRCRPRLVVVCMIYFPDEDPRTSSWATTALSVLQYNSRPQRLQSFIRTVYKVATCDIKVQGTTVVPCALYDAMNGKDSRQYVARVEPSESGADAIAQQLARCIRGGLGLDMECDAREWG